MIRFLVITIMFSFFSVSALAADCGRFKVVKGSVTYKQKSKKKFRKARINKKVCQGDTVKTAKDSRAKIVMADENEINISPNTELLIEVYKEGQKAVLNVLNGKVRSNVKKKYKDNNASHYRVKTKSAVAGVRGTEFLASFNNSTNQSKVVTFEGEVNVGRIEGGRIVGRVSVKPGQFTSNSPGTNPHPAKEVPPQEFAQMNQESNFGSDSGSRDVSTDAATPESNDSGDEAGSDEGGSQQDSKPEQPKAEDNKADSPKAEAPNNEGGSENAGGNDGAAGGVAAGGSNADAPGFADSASSGQDPQSGDGVARDFPDNGDISLDDALGSGDDKGPKGPGAGRDMASVSGPDSFDDLLPPPDMDAMPQMDDIGYQPPPMMTDPTMMLPDNNQCLTCTDAILNQRVNVTIIPVLPGG